GHRDPDRDVQRAIGLAQSSKLMPFAVEAGPPRKQDGGVPLVRPRQNVTDDPLMSRTHRLALPGRGEELAAFGIKLRPGNGLKRRSAIVICGEAYLSTPTCSLTSPFGRYRSETTPMVSGLVVLIPSAGRG